DDVFHAGSLQPRLPPRRPRTSRRGADAEVARRACYWHARNPAPLQLQMRLLAFSDLHRDRERAERLVELAREADVVVGAGDYATMRMGLEGTIEVLSAISAPALLVPGNAESDTELWQACGSWPGAHVLHGQA